MYQFWWGEVGVWVEGYTNVIIQSDEKEVVGLYHEADDRLKIRDIYQEIREIKCSICFIGCEANQDVHRCAKQASVDMRRCL
jgi:hypothetical protein